ncbi:MAG: hypothetical protein PVF58_00060 [Candidatus Methanofastidiosia archaeon]|jgi:hypothetical protein
MSIESRTGNEEDFELSGGFYFLTKVIGIMFFGGIAGVLIYIFSEDKRKGLFWFYVSGIYTMVFLVSMVLLGG